MMQRVVQNNWILDQRRPHNINRLYRRLLIQTLIRCSAYRCYWAWLFPIIISCLRSIVLDYVPSGHPELILIFPLNTTLSFYTFSALSPFWWLFFVLNDMRVAANHAKLPTALAYTNAYPRFNGAHILWFRHPFSPDWTRVELMFTRDKGTPLGLCFADYSIIKTHWSLLVAEIRRRMVIVLL